AQLRISELEEEVTELERECELRRVQEGALKEAVREMERERARAELPAQAQDMDYFKNVVLKLFETGQAESLLPVVATVLRFSPEEVGAAGGRISAGVGSNLIGVHAADRNQEATVYVGNLDPQVTDDVMWEVFVQAGPVASVYMPKDRVTGQHQGYGFVEFRSAEDADYCIKILNMIKLFGKPIRVNKTSPDKTSTDIGANLFLGNLDPDVDEKLLYDTFSAFGVIVGAPRVQRDPETGLSRGFGFVSFDDFESSDAAIDAMHGQFLMNRGISVAYAFKKDTKGERHGDYYERQIAAQRKVNLPADAQRPNALFAVSAHAPSAVDAIPLRAVHPMPVVGPTGFAAGSMPAPGVHAPPPMMHGVPGMVPPPPPPPGAYNASGPAYGAHPGYPRPPPPPPGA
ncbi:hypothetical protein H632_c2332p0, partial [Helicosporidium sp. ATCC 50920]